MATANLQIPVIDLSSVNIPSVKTSGITPVAGKALNGNSLGHVSENDMQAASSTRLGRNQVASLQRELQAQGLYNGAINGIYNEETKQGVKDLQEFVLGFTGDKVTGEVDVNTLKAYNALRGQNGLGDFEGIKVKSEDNSAVNRKYAQDKFGWMNATSFTYPQGATKEQYANDPDWQVRYKYLQDYGKYLTPEQREMRAYKLGVGERTENVQKKFEDDALRTQNYQYATAAEHGLFSTAHGKQNRVKQGEGTESLNSEYSEQKGADFVSRQMQHNPLIQKALDRKGMTATDLLKQNEETYTDQIYQGNLATNSAIRNLEHKRTADDANTKALVDSMHDTQQNFINAGSNLLLGSASNNFWTGMNNLEYGWDKMTGHDSGKHYIGFQERFNNNFTNPLQATDVIGSTGNKWADLGVNILGDPMSWAFLAETWKNIGKVGLQASAEAAAKTAGKEVINPESLKVIPKLAANEAEAVAANTGRAATRQAAQGSVRLQNSLAQLERAKQGLNAAKAAGNKSAISNAQARVREAQGTYTRLLEQEKKAMTLKTSSVNPTSTYTINEHGNFPRGKETWTTAEQVESGMGYAPMWSKEINVGAGIPVGGHKAPLKEDEHPFIKAAKETVDPLESRASYVVTGGGDPCAIAAFRAANARGERDGSIIQGPCGKLYKYVKKDGYNEKGSIKQVFRNTGAPRKLNPDETLNYANNTSYIPDEVKQIAEERAGNSTPYLTGAYTLPRWGATNANGNVAVDRTPTYYPGTYNISEFNIESELNPLYNQMGSKLNYLSIFKDGGIHIKKSHEGRFTDYCNGKVTNECIAKGKKSPNAKIRKMATFAENARKWEH